MKKKPDPNRSGFVFYSYQKGGLSSLSSSVSGMGKAFANAFAPMITETTKTARVISKSQKFILQRYIATQNVQPVISRFSHPLRH